jgi:hypothetical protein
MWEVTGQFVILIISGLVVCQIAYDIFLLLRGDADQRVTIITTFWRLVWMSGAIGFLTNPAVLWDEIFHFFANFGPSIGVRLLNLFSSDPNTEVSMLGLMDVIEVSFFNSIFGMLYRLLSDISFWSSNAFSIVMMGLICAVYLVFLVKILATAIRSFIKVYVVGFFAQFWIAFAVFPETRSIFWHSLRIATAASFQLIASCAAIAIVLASMGAAFQDIADPNNEALLEQVGSPDWFQLLILGVIMIYLINDFTEVPATILQSFISSNANVSGPIGSAARFAMGAANVAGVAAKAMKFVK